MVLDEILRKKEKEFALKREAYIRNRAQLRHDENELDDLYETIWGMRQELEHLKKEEENKKCQEK